MSWKKFRLIKHYLDCDMVKHELRVTSYDLKA